jgi:hypothetical protein
MLVLFVITTSHLNNMNSDHSQNGETKVAFQNRESTLPGLTTVPTSVTLSAEQFERLYLTPMTARQSSLSKQVGNPTPLWVFQSYLICLIVWRFYLMTRFNFQGTRGLCNYYDPPFVLFDGLERCQWKWSCLHVRDNRIPRRAVLIWSTRKVGLLSSLVVFCCS